MSTFKREINGKNFTIFCDYWETRNSWGHEAALYVDSKKIKSYKSAIIIELGKDTLFKAL